MYCWYNTLNIWGIRLPRWAGPGSTDNSQTQASTNGSNSNGRSDTNSAYSSHRHVSKPVQSAGHAWAQLARTAAAPVWDSPHLWKGKGRFTWIMSGAMYGWRWRTPCQTLVRNKPVHLGTEPSSSTALLVMFLSLVQKFSWGIILLNTSESYR